MRCRQQIGNVRNRLQGSLEGLRQLTNEREEGLRIRRMAAGAVSSCRLFNDFILLEHFLTVDLNAVPYEALLQHLCFNALSTQRLNLGVVTFTSSGILGIFNPSTKNNNIRARLTG